MKEKQKPAILLDKPIVPKTSAKEFHFSKPFDEPLQHISDLEDYIDNYDECNPIYFGHNPIKELTNYLGLHPDIKIVATDKNLGMAAFDIRDYNEMVLTHLTTTNYLLINTQSDTALIFNHAFQRSRNNLNILIKSLHRNPSVSNENIGLLKSFSKRADVKLPFFHVLPKLHKMQNGNTTIPSRPIVGATNWFTTPVSKLLSKLLRPIIKTQKHIATNTADIAEDLTFFNCFHSKTLENLDRPVYIITMDISSLYTNINLRTLQELMREKNPDFEILLKYINDHNYFQYDGKTFKQTNGIAMGTNAAPEIANYYLMHLLDPVIISNGNVKLYKRFLDDLFIFWNGTYDQFMQFSIYLNQVIPGISFTQEISKDSGNFLDLKITISSFGNSLPTIKFSTHQKVLNKYAYISPKSCHPVHTLRGFIFGELQRYATNSSSNFFYESTKRIFKKRLLARGYSRQFLEPIFKKHRFLARSQSKPSAALLNMSLRYSYRPRLTTRLGRSIKRHSKRVVGKLIPGTNFIISWKKSPSLFNKLCSSKILTEQSKLLATRNNEAFSALDT